jgi:hypothetical protein
VIGPDYLAGLEEHVGRDGRVDQVCCASQATNIDLGLSVPRLAAACLVAV